MRLPHGVVGGVDHAVAIAVRAAEGRETALAEPVAPHGVVRGVDDAVLIVIAEHGRRNRFYVPGIQRYPNRYGLGLAQGQSGQSAAN